MIGTYRELREVPDYIRYPILVKSDGAWGGRLTNPLILDEPESSGESMASA
jgi:hypothetical protein